MGLPRESLSHGRKRRGRRGGGFAQKIFHAEEERRLPGSVGVTQATSSMEGGTATVGEEEEGWITLLFVVDRGQKRNLCCTDELTEERQDLLLPSIGQIPCRPPTEKKKDGGIKYGGEGLFGTKSILFLFSFSPQTISQIDPQNPKGQ